MKKKFMVIVLSATLVFSSFSFVPVGSLNGNHVANAATLAELEAKFTAINNNLRTTEVPSEVTIVTAARNQLKDTVNANYISDAELNLSLLLEVDIADQMVTRQRLKTVVSQFQKPVHNTQLLPCNSR